MRIKTTGKRISSSPLSIKGTLIVTTALALTLACLNFAPGVLNSSLHLTHLNHDSHREELEQQYEGGGGKGGKGKDPIYHSFDSADSSSGEFRGGAALGGMGAPPPPPPPPRAASGDGPFDGAGDNSGGLLGGGGGGADSSTGGGAARGGSRITDIGTLPNGKPEFLPGPLPGDVGDQPDPNAPGAVSDSPDKYHVIISLGSGTYTQWQSRVCYYWYRKVKRQFPNSAMGGFTRLLHSGQPDPYMEEIPTIVVDPLPPDLQKIANGYVVLDRPYGFKQWAEQHSHKITEKYILMSEPDHVFVLPPPMWATPTRPAAFPFFYIETVKNKDLVNKFNPKKVPIDQFDTIGNSPVLIYLDQFRSIADSWYNISIAIKRDPQADREFGWVQEMYAYSIASAQAPGGPIRYDLHMEMMQQPPWDTSLKSQNGKDAYIIHFTYGNDFDENGIFTPGKVGPWHWDKRDYMARYPPKDFPMPQGNNECVKTLVRRVNEAAQYYAEVSDWDQRAAR